MKETVLFSDDIELLIHWEKSLRYKSRMVDDLDGVSSSMVILNKSACIPTCKDVLIALKKENNDVLVLDRVPDLLKAKEMLKYGANGYGNALMKGHFLQSAIDTINDGLIWLHPELTTQLIHEIPSQASPEKEEILQKLSQREQEVALLLKDGNTYKAVAEQLGITPRTIKAHAQNIYTKLDIKDRISLALLLR